MIDLFGISRQEPSDPPAAGPSEPAPEARAPRGSHRLWAFLLVLDSIFVIVFGGAAAAKMYQYWKTPALVVAQAPVRRHPAAKPAETAKPAPAAAPAAPAAATPPAAPAAKPAEAAKTPEPKAASRADSPRPPKPSLLNEGPKPHSAPAPATAAAASAAPAPAPSAAPGKAVPVVFKIRAPKAGAVQLVGAFIVHGGRKEMTSDNDGVWSVKLYLNPGQYRYFFAVDKKKTLDPENPRSDRGASLLTIP
jgi:hypothetical protein